MEAVGAVDEPPPSSGRTPVPGTLHVVKPHDAPPLTVASERPIARPDAARPISEPPDSGPQIEAREISMPAPKRGGGRMVTLTLLDGTKVNLPAREPATEPRAPRRSRCRPLQRAVRRPRTTHSPARDLVAALRAVAHGADATEILGNEVYWEAMFAALLSLLLKKQLIADWEFVEEYKKV